MVTAELGFHLAFPQLVTVGLQKSGQALLLSYESLLLKDQKEAGRYSWTMSRYC